MHKIQTTIKSKDLELIDKAAEAHQCSRSAMLRSIIESHSNLMKGHRDKVTKYNVMVNGNLEPWSGVFYTKRRADEWNEVHGEYWRNEGKKLVKMQMIWTPLEAEQNLETDTYDPTLDT